MPMKIMFIANPVAGLYKDIESEMIKEGHQVTTLIDVIQKFDPAVKNRFKATFVKRILWEKKMRRYWNELFSARTDLDSFFDVLFVLSGCSVAGFVIERFKKNNPNLRTVLYTWDSCNHYDFERHFPYFDKCYTFDITDTIRNPKWQLLPIYYLSNVVPEGEMVEYDLFSLGSNHDGRYSFIKRILPQLKGLNCYIRIVSKEYKTSLKVEFLKLFGKKRTQIEEILFSQGKENKDILLREGIRTEEYVSLMWKSRVILDDQREGQAGLTARFMWALGMGKKIISTNRWALEYPFVSRKQVTIISKKEPSLPIDFIHEELNPSDASNISAFEISNWVKEILS